ncbi:MAG: FecR domain-containing protein [Treponema sp.]|nr:FecR domain-containing protein [Treponema sp.]
MFRKSLKTIIAFLIVLLSVSPLMAESAKVTYVKGKVEVNRRGNWVAVKVGDTIAESETISTGYQSEARLNLNGTVLAVAALSRVTLETLKSENNQDTVSVYVDTGATRSKVKHADNKKIDYTTRTAVAVASVRGTDYVQFARGTTYCSEGAVAVYSAKEWNPSRKNGKDKTEAKDEAATSNTPVTEISESAPVTAIVVGAGQTSNFSKAGKPELPKAQTEEKRAKALNALKTAAEKENTSNGQIRDAHGTVSCAVVILVQVNE